MTDISDKLVNGKYVRTPTNHGVDEGYAHLLMGLTPEEVQQVGKDWDLVGRYAKLYDCRPIQIREKNGRIEYGFNDGFGWTTRRGLRQAIDVKLMYEAIKHNL